MTSTALIDAGAASGATGAAEPRAGNASAIAGSTPGASADFRSSWQQILNALKCAGAACENQAPLSSLRGVSLQSAGAHISGHADKLCSNARHRPGHSSSATNSEDASASASKPSAKTPVISLTVIPGAAAQPGFTGIHTSAIEVKQNASIELAENLRNEKSGQGPSDPSRDAQGIDGALSGTSPALDDSIDSVGEWGPWLHPHSLQEPAARDIPAHIGAVESGSTLSQSLDGQSASTVNETSSRASDPAVTLQSKNSIPATHAQGHPETVNPGPDVQSPRTPHPTPLSSEVQAQQVRKEDQANHAAAPGSLDTRIAQSKHAVTATVKAAAGVHSAMQTSPLTYSVHPQNQMEAVNPLSSAAITRSESANDLVARDAMQPQASTRSVQDPFTALDARNMRSATWLQAGAHHAEAGYLDPSLGWVSVRAESSGNALHAAIIPGSGEAAQTLGTHLTALNSFMAEHHGRSSTVTLASPDQGQMQGGLTHTGGHSGEGPAQQQLHQEESRGGILTVGSEGIPSTRTSTQHATNPPYTGGGIHISVIA